MTIEINIVEWFLHVLVIILALWAGDTTLKWIDRYYDYKIKKEIDKQKKNKNKSNGK